MSKLDEILEFGQWSEEKQKQQIKDLMLELIGEDDDVHSPINPESEEDLLITLGENANNKLRAELRKKVEEL